MFRGPVLSAVQLRGIKGHAYSAQGISILDRLLQPFWNWLVTLIPLWVAPNLVTFVGLIVNMVTIIPIIYADPNCMGEAPRWMYLACAIGLFVYQSLDAIDGKQARRTKTNTPLGELFDHGCDAISTFFVLLAGASAAGLNEYPAYFLAFVVSIEVLNYCYHWQTYVSGTLYFKTVDVTEGQFTHMAIMVVSFLFGPQVWQTVLPFGVSLKMIVLWSLFGFTFINFVSTFIVILTMGKGKHGSTVADTSVLSPAIPAFIYIGMAVLCAVLSPGNMLETHSILFVTATVFPFVKLVIFMMVAGMSKAPLRLLDILMVGPLLLVVNMLLGALIPEYYLMIVVVIYETYDITRTCVVTLYQVCKYLDISCFTIRSSSPSEQNET